MRECEGCNKPTIRLYNGKCHNCNHKARVAKYRAKNRERLLEHRKAVYREKTGVPPGTTMEELEKHGKRIFGDRVLGVVTKCCVCEKDMIVTTLKNGTHTCSDECAKEKRKRNNTERVRRYRQRKRAEAEGIEL